jgi:hypothetical protein
MVTREEQIEALEKAQTACFEQRMLSHLRSQFPVRLARKSDVQILDLIDQGIVKACCYGITLESDVRRFLEYMVRYGPDFDWREWAWPTLVPPGDGTQKMNVLDGIVTFHPSGPKNVTNC